MLHSHVKLVPDTGLNVVRRQPDSAPVGPDAILFPPPDLVVSCPRSMVGPVDGCGVTPRGGFGLPNNGPRRPPVVLEPPSVVLVHSRHLTVRLRRSARRSRPRQAPSRRGTHSTTSDEPFSRTPRRRRRREPSRTSSDNVTLGTTACWIGVAREPVPRIVSIPARHCRRDVTADADRESCRRVA